MPTNNLPTPITNLDYDGIVSSLQQFLQGQTVFSDYDFSGSGLQVLLQLLAYNTQYLNFYLQMTANEMFLDSAALRQSVVSLASMLGYTPFSRHASQAIVNIVVTPPGSPTPPATLVMPAFTAFTTVIDGITYTFQTTQAYTSNLDVPSQTYIFNNITLVEGSPFTFSSTFSSQVPNQTFIIPNANVDTNQLIIRVQNSIGDTTLNVFTLANDITQLNGSSLVYFLKETADQQYQIFFGDGIIGQALVDGNIVILNYIACNADAPNSAAAFTPSAPVGGFSQIAVTTINNAFGGAERETIESVRFSAPLNFTAQNRAVTQQDYITLLKNQYPNAQSISVWGGENNIPPVYGKVFISIQPVAGFFLTPTEKQFIINEILNIYNVVTIIPEIVDPNYIYLLINSLVKYDPSLTTKSANQVQSLVVATINNYNTADINMFNKTFRYSNLVAQIDQTESSINSNVTSIQMQQRFIPSIGQVGTYNLNFGSQNSIVPSSLSSSLFNVTQDPAFVNLPAAIYGFDDDGAGNIRMFRQSGTSKVYVKLQSGTINYTTGIITITGFIPSAIVDGTNYIKINVTPTETDVEPFTNTIITIDPASVTVNMVSEPR